MLEVTEFQLKLGDIAIYIGGYYLDHDEKLTDGEIKEIKGLQEICEVILGSNKKK